MRTISLVQFPTGFTIQAYADGICVKMSSKDTNSLDPKYKKGIYAIRKSADKNKLKPDVNKCEAIIVMEEREI